MRKVQFLLALGLTLLSAGVFAKCIDYSELGDVVSVSALPGSHIQLNASEDGKVPVVGLGATSPSTVA
jgi:hypothetical protein